jgi:hypothetical protein
MTRRRDDKGRFVRVVDSEFGPVQAGLVTPDFTEWETSAIPAFSSGEDAHEAAWTRESYDRARSNERRNESDRMGRIRVREAFALLDGTEKGREACKSLLVFATWERAQIEQLSDMPTLMVSVR